MKNLVLTYKNLCGTYPAVVTPFLDSGAIDYESLSSLINYLMSHKVDGLVMCGSTGEAATLTDDEYINVVSFALAQVKQSIPCIVGINSSSTARARQIADKLRELGVDAGLLVGPPYNKPSQEGLYLHFRQVAASTLPIVAYNIPGRSVCNILPKTVARLVKDRLIIGIKEASGSLDQLIDLVAAVGVDALSDFSILSGEDSLVHSIMASGGRGVISASANLIPDAFVRLTQAALSKDFDRSLQIQLEMLPIVRSLFIETNPVPVKAALVLKGIIKSNFVRLPLVAAQPTTIELLRELV